MLGIRQACAIWIAVSASIAAVSGCSESDESSCGACDVADYTCNGTGQTEAHALVVEGKQAGGCVGVYGYNKIPVEIRCDPLEVCLNGCKPATFENDRLSFGSLECY
jgi:hypothetical protein